MKNTYQELKLTNDEVVKLTLNFGKLMKIKSSNKELYTRLMNILNGGFDDIIDSCLTVIYVAYLCANDKDVLSEGDFIELVPFDLEAINVIASELITPKKK